MIMKSSVFLVICCVCLFNEGLEKINAHVIGEPKLFAEHSFLQGRADIVFLLDRSGSVGAANFEIQKGFVESLLTHVAVDANATRVAVISYSNTAELHINYVANPKTKCHLSQELQDLVYRNSGATNTAAAFSEARRVLLDGRPNINKVVIIISDGISTAGDDPVAAANRLKKDTGAQVFAFGIGKYLGSELNALASSADHVYNCEGFQEFKHLARKIRGDPHENVWSADSQTPNCDHLCDSPYKGEANDPGCCDHHAKCSCALLAGLHTCVCLPGHFGLEGTWGACRACPRGTYKSGLEPSKSCTPCPPGSTTDEEASTSVKDCHCKEGYSRTLNDDSSCSLIDCPPLQPPTNGIILGRCQNTFGSECLFMCNDGYEFAERGTDIRTCQKNGDWSGPHPICKKMLCSAPLAPENGFVTCDYGEHLVGKSCKFGCDKGYVIQGSKRRKCSANKQWTGPSAQCVAVQCPAPKALRHGSIKNCRSDRNPVHQEICIFRCNDGFERSGPLAMICNKNGQLVDYYNQESQEEPFCNDIRNPEIICPKNVVVNTKPGKDYAIVDWELAKAFDNSGEPPKIKSNPAGFKPPLALDIGTTTATFTAIDRSGKQASCSFNITVKDEEPPRVLSCPETIRVNASDVQAQVFWEEPQFNDNSQKKVVDIYKNAKSGSFFGLGSHTIFYNARDSSGNSADCIFEVIVARNNCPYYPAPTNGALVCDEWMHGQFCQVQCNYDFDFFSKPAEWYICNTAAQWETLPADEPIPWPDCSRKVPPDGFRQMINAYYYYGDCNDPRVQYVIRSAFLYQFQTKFAGKGYCQPKGTCNVKAIKVTCGATDNRGVRRKRGIWDAPIGENLNIEFVITIGNDEKFVLSDDILQDFINTTENLEWSFSDEFLQELLALNDTQNNNSTNARLGYVSITSSEVSVLCPSGSVYKDNECVLCSAGTFHNLILNDCFPCARGWYQDVEGQTECVQCPPNMSTENENSKNLTDCKVICSDGTFSSTGLQTCLACPIGSFQNRSQQSECQRCPHGTSTATEGSLNEDDCQKPCHAGFYSKTGLEPCTPCPFGYYQPLEGQKTCKECDESLTTLNIGSHSLVDCIDYNACENNSRCKNGAACSMVGREIACQCPDGFTGTECETDVDECLSDPCFNNGSCINSDGGFSCSCTNDFQGDFCEEKIKACDSAPCSNGGTCYENNGSYLCHCPVDFEGASCEILDSHVNVACKNEGLCQDDLGQSTLQCTEGSDCPTNSNKCLDVTCFNGGSTFSNGSDSCRCICPKGFTGDSCEININECENHDCSEGSTCKDLIGSYKCLCPPGWNGARCENKISSDFILHFPEKSSLANMVIKSLDSSLTNATVSMWVQTKDTHRSGTLLSYATLINTNELNGNFQVLDNALTISDCSGLSIFINNEQLITDIAINDGLWHHFVFSWAAENNGEWRAYKDGHLHSNGNGFQPNAEISSGGQLILGQEQDEILGGFNPLETFVGNITRLNIWNTFLGDSDVFQLYDLNENVKGKILAWPDFLDGVAGHVKILPNEKPYPQKTIPKIP